MNADVAYPGARPFGRDDSGKFFGRSEEADELSALWLGHPLTFLYGPAGIGKTSLLAAGVLPLVNRNNVELLPVGGFSRGSSSPAVPAGSYTPYTLALLRAWSAYSPVRRLNPFTVDEFVIRHSEQRDPSVLILAAIDQADDLFVGPPSRQRQREHFLRELADALRHPSLRLFICVREEGLPHYTKILGEGVQVRLGGLEPDRAREAVERPGLFDPEAARELVEALRTSHLVDRLSGSRRRVVADQVEPALLQAACARLWDLLRVHRTMITPEDLRQHGDVDTVLSAHCGAAIAAVADVHGVPAPWLRSWLVGTFVAATGGREEVPDSQAGSAGLSATVATALEDRHLLRASSARPRGSRLYQLISDRVIEPLRLAQASLPGGDPSGHLLAAERALTAGELILAERYAQLARATAPDTDLVLHGSAYSLLGNLARQQSNLVQAEEYYRTALTMFETAMEHTMVVILLVAIGRTLIDRGEVIAGIRQLYAAAERMPADATIQTEFSEAAYELSWQLQNEPRRPRISPG